MVIRKIDIHWSLTFYLLSFIIIITTSDNATECERHRRPWHLISDEDRMQFVTGFQLLRSNGILSSFAGTHHLEGVAFEDIHKTSEFFYWHSYFVWEVESQFRLLGDDYACFSMPYWDITYDAQFLQNEDPYNPTPTSDIPIYNSMLGGDGNSSNDRCVEDPLWNIDKYKTEFLCSDDENKNEGCCLKRERNIGIADAATFVNGTEFLDTFKLHRYRDFLDQISLYHGKVHKFFAKTNESHMSSNNAAEDPIFVLLHSFLDYIRSMRSDCWEYDLVPNDKLDDYIPFAFDGYITYTDMDGGTYKPNLDTVMAFAFICDIESTFCNDNDVTIRNTFDISVNTQWGVSYEPGTFWSDNDDLQTWCADKLNSTWFYTTDGAQSQAINDEITTGSIWMWSIVLALMYVFWVFLIQLLLKRCVNCKRRKQENEFHMNIRRRLIDSGDEEYGSRLQYGSV